MGKHTQPRPPRTSSWRQTAQNIALPLVLLLVVGGVAVASPTLRAANDEPAARPTAQPSAEPTPTAEPTPAPSSSPRAKPRKRAGAALAFRAGIVPATAFVREPKAKQKPTVPRSFVRVLRASLVPTQFTVSSWNVLGHGHTVPGGNRPGWASGHTRIRWAVSMLRARGVDVVGLQEFQMPQFQTFNAVAGGEYAVFPGGGGGAAAVQNSIAWRRAEWELVEAHTIGIPYFTRPVPMPYVLLEHQQTGQRAWFTNFHNPADAHGPAEGKRDQATGMEIALFNRLRAISGDPVVVTGDMNERDEYLCRVAAGAGMHSADGGSASGGVCRRPPRMNVDWIMATGDVQFSGFAALRTGLPARVSDHPMVVSQAEVGATQDAAQCEEKDTSSPYVWCPPG